jgi:hypothetical protein
MKAHPFLAALLLSSGCAVATNNPVPPVGENPPPGVDAALWKTVDTLVANLGSEEWSVRDAAQKELEALPVSALEAVQASVERRSEDPEIKHRGGLAAAVLAENKAYRELPVMNMEDRLRDRPP